MYWSEQTNSFRLHRKVSTIEILDNLAKLAFRGSVELTLSSSRETVWARVFYVCLPYPASSPHPPLQTVTCWKPAVKTDCLFATQTGHSKVEEETQTTTRPISTRPGKRRERHERRSWEIFRIWGILGKNHSTYSKFWFSLGHQADLSDYPI